jgi:hypothetical protein
VLISLTLGKDVSNGLLQCRWLHRYFEHTIDSTITISVVYALFSMTRCFLKHFARSAGLNLCTTPAMCMRHTYHRILADIMIQSCVVRLFSSNLAHTAKLGTIDRQPRDREPRTDRGRIEDVSISTVNLDLCENTYA